MIGEIYKYTVSIGVVGCSVGVGPHPLDEVVVPGHQREVQSLAPDVRVLVPPKPSDIDRMVILFIRNFFSFLSCSIYCLNIYV